MTAIAAPLFTINGRTSFEQAMAHSVACQQYAIEALAAGNIGEAEAHVNAAASWVVRARDFS